MTSRAMGAAVRPPVATQPAPWPPYASDRTAWDALVNVVRR